MHIYTYCTYIYMLYIHIYAVHTCIHIGILYKYTYTQVHTIYTDIHTVYTYMHIKHIFVCVCVYIYLN